MVNAGFGSAGERCMAISACVAVGPIADDLVAKIAERATGIKTGDGTGDADMGPLITEARGPPRQGGLLHRRRRDRRS
jgi:malonate-semialdehyde dehydrogenase (acetylating)/methylmalonate-semialdehyde dehydrogenase